MTKKKKYGRRKETTRFHQRILWDLKEDEEDMEYEIEIEGRKTAKLRRRGREGANKMKMTETKDNIFIGIKTIKIYFFRILTCCFQFWEKGKKISGNLSQNFEYG